jgi:hypothetical protein
VVPKFVVPTKGFTYLRIPLEEYEQREKNNNRVG